MATSCQIHVKRVYEPPAKADGMRILVDRLWPRGLSKASAKIDLWLKEIAPSDELRKWFGHQEERWEEFQKRYRQELENNPQEVDRLSAVWRRNEITLLYAASDDRRNNAAVLKNFLEETGAG